MVGSVIQGDNYAEAVYSSILLNFSGDVGAI